MSEKTLFERIGGDAAVEAAVDEFYGRVLNDPAINHHFKNTDMEELAEHQYNFMRFAFGGPNMYTGRELREAHAHLKITEEEFMIVAKHLEASLQHLELEPNDIYDIMTIVATTKDDILNK